MTIIINTARQDRSGSTERRAQPRYRFIILEIDSRAAGRGRYGAGCDKGRGRANQDDATNTARTI